MLVKNCLWLQSHFLKKSFASNIFFNTVTQGLQDQLMLLMINIDSIVNNQARDPTFPNTSFSSSFEPVYSRMPLVRGNPPGS
jgi:hypothetical protein